jgi:hypothetical protein
MKKILLVALTLFVAGTMYADKKCCKDKASCSKKEACASKTEAKACSKDAAGGKSCCKKGGEGTAAVNADGTTGVAPAHCSKSSTMKACCKKDAASHAPVQDAKPASDK